MNYLNTTILAAAMLMLIGGTAAAGQLPRAQLTVDPAEGTVQGQRSTIEIRLADADGDPLVGESVQVLASLRFFNHRDVVELGHVVTDHRGRASLTVKPTHPGSRQVIAVYEGGEAVAPTTVSVPWEVEYGDAPLASQKSESWQPPGGAGLWIMLVLLAMWGALGYAIFQIASLHRRA